MCTCPGENFEPRHVTFQVLFCGEEFPWSYCFTKEALQDDPGFQVGGQGHPLGNPRRHTS